MRNLETMEVYDDSIKAIRIMYESKGKSLIKNNGIQTDEKGQIIAGRFADFSAIEQQSLIDAGILEMRVIDEPNRNNESVRTFGKKVEEKKKEIKEVSKEETPTDTQTENEIKEEVKPVKKRKPRKKKEVK